MKNEDNFQNDQYKNIYVLEAKMENRTCEEIAKDFTDQIVDLIDKLIEQKRKNEDSEICKKSGSVGDI